VELLNLGIEIVEGWYNVGNTKHDVGTLRFKDFICMVNFFWVVCLFDTVLGNRYVWIL
jgi:hypothetical protein